MDMLLELDSDMNSNHVVFENGSKVIYVVVLKIKYVMLISGLLFYKNLC